MKCFGKGNRFTEWWPSPHIEFTCNKYLKQNRIGDFVPTDSNSITLMHLAQRHFAIDFLIVDDTGVKKLCFIQVSCQFYKKRAKDNRYSAVKKGTYQLGDKSPLDYYSRLYKVDEICCVYVYSSPQHHTDTDIFEKDEDYVYVHYLQ